MSRKDTICYKLCWCVRYWICLWEEPGALALILHQMSGICSHDVGALVLSQTTQSTPVNSSPHKQACMRTESTDCRLYESSTKRHAIKRQEVFLEGYFDTSRRLQVVYGSVVRECSCWNGWAVCFFFFFLLVQWYYCVGTKYYSDLKVFMPLELFPHFLTFITGIWGAKPTQSSTCLWSRRNMLAVHLYSAWFPSVYTCRLILFPFCSLENTSISTR